MTETEELNAAHAVAESMLDEARAKVAALTADLAARDAELSQVRARLEWAERERHTLRHQVETLTPIAARSTAAESRVRELEGALRSIGCLFYGWRGGECATVAPRGERCARCAALSPRTVAADAQKETGR